MPLWHDTLNPFSQQVPACQAANAEATAEAEAPAAKAGDAGDTTKEGEATKKEGAGAGKEAEKAADASKKHEGGAPATEDQGGETSANAPASQLVECPVGYHAVNGNCRPSVATTTAASNPAASTATAAHPAGTTATALLNKPTEKEPGGTPGGSGRAGDDEQREIDRLSAKEEHTAEGDSEV
jgi:hypothetical protein